MKEKPATVSSYLNRMFKQGDIDRQKSCGVTGTAYGYWHGHQLIAFKK